jgi:hypothetical protein
MSPITAVEYWAAEDKFLTNMWITTLNGAISTAYGAANVLASGFGIQLPTSTIQLTGSTSGWPSSGTCDFFSGGRLMSTVTYSSIGSNSSGPVLQGCSGGTIVLSNGWLAMARISETWAVNAGAPTKTGGAACTTPCFATIDGRGSASMEIIMITSVGTTPFETLTVQRGYGTPTYTHSDGARFQSNVTLAAGYAGSDNNSSCDLGNNTVAWFGEDVDLPSGGGLTKLSFPVIRNIIGIQSGSPAPYDLGDSGTSITWYTATARVGHGLQFGVDELVPDQPHPDGSHQPIGIYMTGGCMIGTSGVMMILGLANATVTGGLVGIGDVAILVDNPDEAPTSWNFRITNTWANTQIAGAVPRDGGDGYIYFSPGRQRAGLTNQVDGAFFYSGRWTYAQALQGDLMNPQFWCGPKLGWTNERVWDKHTPRMLWINSQVLPFVDQSTVHRRVAGDNKFQLTVTDSATLKYALTDYTAQFPFFTSVYTIPNFMQGFAYGGDAHPEQTWSGKGANDCLLSFLPGFASGPAPETYFVHLVKVSGI